MAATGRQFPSDVNVLDAILLC